MPSPSRQQVLFPWPHVDICTLTSAPQGGSGFAGSLAPSTMLLARSSTPSMAKDTAPCFHLGSFPTLMISSGVSPMVLPRCLFSSKLKPNPLAHFHGPLDTPNSKLQLAAVPLNNFKSQARLLPHMLLDSFADLPARILCITCKSLWSLELLFRNVFFVHGMFMCVCTPSTARFVRKAHFAP